MFPHQVQAIVADERGVQVLLADKADVPDSPPLFVQACGRKTCRWFITFSGQQVNVNGETWDVFVNRQNQVIVAGHSTDHYRIAAHPLEDNS